MIKQLGHICLFSEDLAKTESFYVEGLGMERVYDFEKNSELFGFYLKAGSNTFIEVFKGKPGEVGNINHIALEVEDIDAAIERLKHHGIDMGEKKLGGDQTWQAWLEDPNGVQIELQQYTPESYQFRGGTCIVDW